MTAHEKFLDRFRDALATSDAYQLGALLGGLYAHAFGEMPNVDLGVFQTHEAMEWKTALDRHAHKSQKDGEQKRL